MIDLAIMAARSALAVTRVPATRSIGYEKGEVEVGAEMQEQSGISGLVKGGKGGSKAVDFELIDVGWAEGERLEGWQDLPVGLTLNLVSSFSISFLSGVEDVDLLERGIDRLINCLTWMLRRWKKQRHHLRLCFVLRVKEICAV